MNPEYPIRLEKRKKSFACTRFTSDTVPGDLRFLPDVMSRLKCNLCQISDFQYEISFFHVYSCHMYTLDGYTQVFF